MSKHVLGARSKEQGNRGTLRKGRASAAVRKAVLDRCMLESLEQRQLLSVTIPLLNSDFESPTWVKSGSSWVQQAVAPGTQALNYNELDPRFGPPGYGKTAQGGGRPGPNGEGFYNEHNDPGYNQYFNYVNNQLPAPANGTNFFCLQPAPGGTYHFWLDEQPNTTVDAGNHGDVNYPPLIAPTTAQAGHTYQATVALGNPLVNTGRLPDVEFDLTIGAGTYYQPSNTNSYNYATGQTVTPQSGDNSLYYDGGGITVATAWARGSSDPNWNIAAGTFKDLNLTWTCPPEYNGLPLDFMFVYAGVQATTCMDNLRLVDLTADAGAPAAPSNFGAGGIPSVCLIPSPAAAPAHTAPMHRGSAISPVRPTTPSHITPESSLLPAVS